MTTKKKLYERGVQNEGNKYELKDYFFIVFRTKRTKKFNLIRGLHCGLWRGSRGHQGLEEQIRKGKEQERWKTRQEQDYNVEISG